MQASEVVAVAVAVSAAAAATSKPAVTINNYSIVWFL